MTEPLKKGERVLVPVLRPGVVIDADPPAGTPLEGHVLVAMPGEIPPRWWIRAELLERNDPQ